MPTVGGTIVRSRALDSGSGPGFCTLNVNMPAAVRKFFGIIALSSVPLLKKVKTDWPLTITCDGLPEFCGRKLFPLTVRRNEALPAVTVTGLSAVMTGEPPVILV